jgi:hypothetical protein
VRWIEHRTHQLRCRHCLAPTSARLPAQIAGSAFGPRLQAAVVTLTAWHRISRRGFCELSRDLFGTGFSTGASETRTRDLLGAIMARFRHSRRLVPETACGRS